MENLKKNSYLKKAESGDAEAMYLLAQEYENEGDFDAAFLWHNEAANHGAVGGIHSVAMYYLEGFSVVRDVARAIKLLESIADEFPVAKINLGCICLEGDGCPRDSRKGMELLRQAADSGEGLAAFAIGKIYLDGLCGLPVDYGKAAPWLEKSYELGIYECVDILCDLYGGKYSHKLENTEKYRQWSDARKDISGRTPNRYFQSFPPRQPVTDDGSGVSVMSERNGRQYVIIDNEKAYVDLLVAETFLPNVNPAVYTEVEHIDGDMSDNSAQNLRWVEKK